MFMLFSTKSLEFYSSDFLMYCFENKMTEKQKKVKAKNKNTWSKKKKSQIFFKEKSKQIQRKKKIILLLAFGKSTHPLF